MISTGQPNITRDEILKHVNEPDIIGHYLGITHIPCLIHSPLRADKNPSFYLYSPNGTEVNYIDLSTHDRGSCMNLLTKVLNITKAELYTKIRKDLVNMNKVSCVKGSYTPKVSVGHHSELKTKVREWRDYDIEYWGSFGITLDVLKWAEVYPISHKFIIQDGNTMTFSANKYAYTFIERKEGKVTQKVYQPFNREGYKWQNSHDKSVLGLWSKLPPKGENVCICASVKDALCLICNMKIPCICLQGEGYPISDTASLELRKRFRHIFICLDNDKPGIENAQRLVNQHGFINIEIPQFANGKDISDFYKANGKEIFVNTFKELIKEALEAYYNELPF